MENTVHFATGEAVQDDDTGVVHIRGRGYDTDEITLWPSDADRLRKWLQNRSEVDSSFYVYYRKMYRDHIVKDGDTICSIDVNVPSPDSEKLKPLEEVTDHEWQLHRAHADFCTYCSGMARRMDIWPDIPPEEPESFRCPECDDPVDRVSIQMGTTIAEHEDGRQHEINHSDFQEWRQGGSHF